MCLRPGVADIRRKLAEGMPDVRIKSATMGVIQHGTRLITERGTARVLVRVGPCAWWSIRQPSGGDMKVSSCGPVS